MPSARRAPRQVLPAAATARNQSRASAGVCRAAPRMLAEDGLPERRLRRGRGLSKSRSGLAGLGGPGPPVSFSQPISGTGRRSGPTERAGGRGLPGQPV